MKRAGFSLLWISGLIISTSDSVYFPWPNIVGAALFLFSAGIVKSEREDCKFNQV